MNVCFGKCLRTLGTDGDNRQGCFSLFVGVHLMRKRGFQGFQTPNSPAANAVFGVQDGDGCSSTCEVEAGWTCTREAAYVVSFGLLLGAFGFGLVCLVSFLLLAFTFDGFLGCFWGWMVLAWELRLFGLVAWFKGFLKACLCFVFLVGLSGR